MKHYQPQAETIAVWLRDWMHQDDFESKAFELAWPERAGDHIMIRAFRAMRDAGLIEVRGKSPNAFYRLKR